MLSLYKSKDKKCLKLLKNVLLFLVKYLHRYTYIEKYVIYL